VNARTNCWLSLALADHSNLPGTAGKTLLKHLIALDTPNRPTISSLIAEHNLRSAASDITQLCQKAIESLPKEAEAVRNGNERVVMRLVGYIMKSSGGTADAQKARRILLELLAGSK
jgi:aspartyl-tRNA(Asn)/glutamyl-tRNA(Gln) amidotransferase subunit B